jgi:hypothetical protein
MPGLKPGPTPGATAGGSAKHRRCYEQTVGPSTAPLAITRREAQSKDDIFYLLYLFR